MPKVAVKIDEIVQETEISLETKSIIEEAAEMWDLPEVWFLFETVRKYGMLTERNILSYIYWLEEEE